MQAYIYFGWDWYPLAKQNRIAPSITKVVEYILVLIITV